MGTRCAMLCESDDEEYDDMIGALIYGTSCTVTHYPGIVLMQTAIDGLGRLLSPHRRFRRTRTAPLAPSQIRSRIELSFGSQTRSRVKRETSPSPLRIRGIRLSNDSPSEWNGYCGTENDTDGNDNAFGQ